MNFRSMEEFWPFYVNQHSKPATRRWHFVGTLTGIFFLFYSAFFNWWCVFLVPLFGYGFAWYSHFFVEGNVPATFGHPIWSLLCDFKMFGLMLTGQMDKEIKRLGKRPVLQVFWFLCKLCFFFLFLPSSRYICNCISPCFPFYLICALFIPSSFLFLAFLSNVSL